MTAQELKRRLTAILCADVVGYSRLMQDDEAAMLKTLESYKTLIYELVAQHRGRVVDFPEDNLIVDFASVVDAVQCAVEMQKEVRAHNLELPENRKMKFRIGVNLGNVIEEESRIYGDGVNISARLKSLADPGGICISKTVFDQIKTKLLFGYAYLGEQSFKNIAKPVKVLKVLMDQRVTKEGGAGLKTQGAGAGRRMAAFCLVAALVVVSVVALSQLFLRPVLPPAERADPDKMAIPLPEQPSIAILPFVNLSEDPKHELLCDGITDNLINAFSKVPRLFVIAGKSTSTYKGKAVKVKQVSEELGVQYVLEGSVQRSGERVRITSQLVDALSGHQLWSERYDGESADFFALQDDITMKVLGAVESTLEGSGTEWMKYYSGSQGLDCYLKIEEAWSYIQRGTISDNNQARQITEENLEKCPEIPAFYRTLGVVNIYDYWLGSAKSPRESIEKAAEFLHKALAIDDNYASAHAHLSEVYIIKKEYDRAIAEAERAVTLEPGSAWPIFSHAVALTRAGRPEEAIPLFKKAIRLNPLGEANLYRNYALALQYTGQLEAAAASYRKAIELAPEYFWSHAHLAATYSMMGRDKEAHAEAAEVMRINPSFSLEFVSKTTATKDKSQVEKTINAMRKAGLPTSSGIKTAAVGIEVIPKDRSLTDKSGNATRKVKLPADSIALSATVGTEDIILKLQETISCINSLSSQSFKDSNMKKALANKVNAVIDDATNGQYGGALRKLENDVMQRTDGCSKANKPDKNDWISACTAQDRVYELVMDATDMLEDLM